MKTSCGNIKIFSVAVCALLLAMAGCGRGLPFEKPPSNIDRGMSKQPKYRPQAEGDFFADKSTMRMPVPGTAAREELRQDDSYYQGKDSLGNFVRKAPVALTMQILKRGRKGLTFTVRPVTVVSVTARGSWLIAGIFRPPVIIATDCGRYRMVISLMSSAMVSAICPRTGIRYRWPTAGQSYYI